MLTLNKNKIRKGKSVGLPYLGSKKKIAKQIVEIIKQNFDTDCVIYDIFGGGGAITAECLVNGLHVHYNDKNKVVVDMVKTILDTDRDYIKTLICSRDEFIAIKNKQDKTTDDYLKLLINSFGNRMTSYLYGRDIADVKYQAAKEIIANHDVFSGYRQTDTYKKYLWDESLQQMQALEQLQRLQQLDNFRSGVDGDYLVDMTSYDYREFSHLKDSVIYLDPPYENTTKYYVHPPKTAPKELYNFARDKLLQEPKGSELVLEGFKFWTSAKANGKQVYVQDLTAIIDVNHQDFYDWAYEMSKNNIVLLSSYKVSDDRFKEVYEFPTARSTLSGGNNGKNCEKLFMVL